MKVAWLILLLSQASVVNPQAVESAVGKAADFTTGTSDTWKLLSSHCGGCSNVYEEPAVFSCDVSFPTNAGLAANVGTIWGSGGSGFGTWVGIENNGTHNNLRARSGNGGYEVLHGNQYTDAAFVDIPDYPTDGATHRLTVFLATQPLGYVVVYIDGFHRGIGFATTSMRFSGGDEGTFILRGRDQDSIPVGEENIAWQGGYTGDLRYYHHHLCSGGNIEVPVPAANGSAGLKCGCAWGYERLSTGASCTLCPSGKYKDSLGDTNCLACATGSSSTDSLRTSCTCDAGYSGSLNGPCTPFLCTSGFNNGFLTHWYEFGNGSLTTDFSGNGRTLVQSSNPATLGSTSECKAGNCVRLNNPNAPASSTSTNAFLTMPTVEGSLYSTNGFTIAIWFKLTSGGLPGSCMRLFELRTAAGNNADDGLVYISLNCGGNDLALQIRDPNNGGTSESGVDSANPALDNTADQWRHIVWSIAASGQWVVFVDGSKLLDVTKVAFPNIQFTSALIGKSTFDSDAIFNGYFDGYRIYQSALSDTAIQNIYQHSHACPCDVGEFGPLGGECTKCPAGEYKDTIGTAQCNACPANTHSKLGSVTITSCICNAGYIGNDGEACNACPAGAYKAGNGSAEECLPCAPGKFNPNEGADTCLQCPVGKYKATNGSGSCAACDAGKYSSGGLAEISEAVCTGCPTNTHSDFGSHLLTNCTCNRGYYGNDGEACTACEDGKFKPTNGSDACSSCEAGKYSSGGLAEVSESTCSDCPPHTHSDHGSGLLTNCSCNKGYFGNDGEACNECEVGKFKGTNGSYACSACGAGKFSTGSAEVAESVCLDCPANTHSGFGSGLLTNCTCNKGYSGNDGEACVACRAGKHKATNGSGSCAACDAGKYSSGGLAEISEAVCTGCPTNTHSDFGSHLLTNCTCNRGYYGNDGEACTACDPGTYKAFNGSSGCVLCQEGTFSTGTAEIHPSACLACPSNSNAGIGSYLSINCSCNMGYTGYDGELCSSCVAGTYKQQNGSLPCEECPGDFYSPVDAATSFDTCTSCPARSVSSPGAGQITSCICISGYFGTGGEDCLPCPKGTFKESNGTAGSCSACPLNSYSNATAATSFRTCSECPANSVSHAGAALRSECICNTGFSGVDCLVFAFNDVTPQTRIMGVTASALMAIDGSEFDRISANLIVLVQEFIAVAGMTVSAEVVASKRQLDSTSSHNTISRNGTSDATTNFTLSQLLFYMVTGDHAVNHVTGRIGSKHLTTFLEINGMPAINVTSVAVSCGSGRTVVDGRCQPCPQGTYKHLHDNSSCISCGPNATTATADSQSPSDCLCIPGFYQGLENGSVSNTTFDCVICEENFYCPGGSELPVECDSGATAPIGSVSADNCTENAAVVLGTEAAGVASAAVAAVIATTVGATVAGSVASGVAGGAAGGAGGGGGGGGSGGATALIQQVQFTSMLGSIGGEKNDSGIAAFSDGFGWATLDFESPVSLGGSRRRGSTFRRAAQEEQTCSVSVLDPLIQKIALVIVITATCSALRQGLQSGVKWKWGTHLPELDFPAWEGPAVLAQFFPLCKSVGQVLGTGCYWWSLIACLALILGPGAFLMMGLHAIWFHFRAGNLQFNVAPLPGLKSTVEKIRHSEGFQAKCLVCASALFALKKRGAWKPNTPQAKKWAFLVGPYTQLAVLFFAWVLLLHILRSLFLFVAEGKFNAGAMFILQVVDCVLRLILRPFNDTSANFNNITSITFNTFSIALIAIPDIFGIPDGLKDLFSDAVMIWTNLATTAFLAVGALLGPVFQLASLVTWLTSCCAGPVFTAVKAVVLKQFQKNFEKRAKERIAAHKAKKEEEQQKAKEAAAAGDSPLDSTTNGDNGAGTEYQPLNGISDPVRPAVVSAETAIVVDRAASLNSTEKKDRSLSSRIGLSIRRSSSTGKMTGKAWRNDTPDSIRLGPDGALQVDASLVYLTSRSPSDAKDVANPSAVVGNSETFDGLSANGTGAVHNGHSVPQFANGQMNGHGPSHESDAKSTALIKSNPRSSHHNGPTSPLEPVLGSPRLAEQVRGAPQPVSPSAPQPLSPSPQWRNGVLRVTDDMMQNMSVVPGTPDPPVRRSRSTFSSGMPWSSYIVGSRYLPEQMSMGARTLSSAQHLVVDSSVLSAADDGPSKAPREELPDYHLESATGNGPGGLEPQHSALATQHSAAWPSAVRTLNPSERIVVPQSLSPSVPQPLSPQAPQPLTTSVAPTPRRRFYV